MKYISFALFGADPKYRRGMMENIRSSNNYFPGWHILIYCDAFNFDALNAASLPGHVECILQRRESTGVEGMTWRLLAVLRPDAEAVMFRDADSTWTHRERAAVAEWWSSTFDTHIIRDHPYHKSPIMGGLLAVRGPALLLLARLVNTRMQSHRLTQYGDDQVFLTHDFYPKARKSAMVHTNCVRFFLEYATPLSDDDSDQSFIGAYAFLKKDEQEEYEAIRRNTPPVTLIPEDLKRFTILRKFLKKLDGKKGIKYHCRWCI
jgi:hypothetical protein